ncbi:MAG: FAD-dependent oxidoreductase [Smithellaceae bacterium]|nr:FAD-dependent oxidoreductase [Smithellaceae bacterium]
MKILIIGGGIAGNEVAALLAGQNGMELTILSAESHPEYDPCSLPYYVGGVISRNAVFRKNRSFYEKAGIKLVLDSPVVTINSTLKTVTTIRGEEYPYDRLVLAHGGSLFIPPIPGIDQQGVFSCKSLDEADRLAGGGGGRAVVIGSGAIGVEVAEALKRRDCEVTIVEVLPWILPALFDEPGGRLMERALADLGIRVFTSERVQTITGNGKVSGVVTDRREIPCDTVVIATGVIPGKALAETAGLATGRGILVDDRMSTSVEDIYACGDCVETPDACTGELGLYQLKHNAIDQARVVARNILGREIRYPGGYVFARVHFFDTHGVTFGKSVRSLSCEPSSLRIMETTKDRDYLRIILKDEMIVGGQAIGRFADLTGPLMAAMWRREKVGPLLNGSAEKTPPLSSFPWLRRGGSGLFGSPGDLNRPL